MNKKTYKKKPHNEHEKVNTSATVRPARERFWGIWIPLFVLHYTMPYTMPLVVLCPILCPWKYYAGSFASLLGASTPPFLVHLLSPFSMIFRFCPSSKKSSKKVAKWRPQAPKMEPKWATFRTFAFKNRSKIRIDFRTSKKSLPGSQMRGFSPPRTLKIIKKHKENNVFLNISFFAPSDPSDRKILKNEPKMKSKWSPKWYKKR